MRISKVPNDRPGAADDDLLTESAVLGRVLSLHPTRITIAELIRELAGEEVGFEDQDAIRRAVRDLSGVGLVHLQQQFVSPSRAALRFQELQDR
jgi:DNA-binding transcriptional regulator PaaX